VAVSAPRSPPAAWCTWIAARDSGVVLALLNHQPARGAPAPAASLISRGRLIAALAGEAGVPDGARLRDAGLASFAPFRLFVAAPAVPPRVFTWNGVALTSRRLDPRAGFLTSSSWNPRAVLPARHARFRAFRRAHPSPSRRDLVAFHDEASDVRGGAWAIRMSRNDARTVSVTAIEVTASGVRMRYRAVR